MDLEVQCQRAEAFRRMHDRSRILVLPNARDAMSARIFETAGFTAIATTSAGVSYSIGYPDGELVPRDEMIAAVGRIAHRESATLPEILSLPAATHQRRRTREDNQHHHQRQIGSDRSRGSQTIHRTSFSSETSA